MKKIHLAFGLAILAGLLIASAAVAQGDTLTLSLSRDFGYGGFGGDIQGTFSMRASGPSSLTRVEFYIDETKIGEVTQAPFHLQFVTDNYPLGPHDMYAIGYTSDEKTIRSQTIHATFVSASEGTQAVLKFVIPLLVVVFGAMLLAAVVPIVLGRRTVRLEPGTARQYTLGGAICPKCGRPFAIHLYGMNLLGRKLDRCPYCGKWSLVRYASIDQLRAAEQAEVQAAQAQVPEESAEEKLKKELDDSKYQEF
jgi:hypothetical protein